MRYVELPEATEWSDPVFQTVLKPLNLGDYKGVCRAAEALAEEYGHFGILYWWWGSALRKMGLLDQARQVMTDALEKVNEKYSLQSGLAEVEWEARNLEEMVYWLAQAMHAQEFHQYNNYGNMADSYLHLSYIAQGLGLHKCSTAFLQRVDSINYSVRLNRSAANDLIELTKSERNPYIEEVIRKLVETYL